MQRPDFEIAMLELDAMTEEVNNYSEIASKVHEQLISLKNEGYAEFQHFPMFTDETLQCFLVALDRVQNGKPKRWFEKEQKDLKSALTEHQLLLQRDNFAIGFTILAVVGILILLALDTTV